MRLALESDTFKSQDLDRYRQRPEIWHAPRLDRSNPWHPDLKEIMFYL